MGACEVLDGHSYLSALLADVDLPTRRTQIRYPPCPYPNLAHPCSTRGVEMGIRSRDAGCVSTR